MSTFTLSYTESEAISRVINGEAPLRPHPDSSGFANSDRSGFQKGSSGDSNNLDASFLLRAAFLGKEGWVKGKGIIIDCKPVKVPPFRIAQIHRLKE